MAKLRPVAGIERREIEPRVQLREVRIFMLPHQPAKVEIVGEVIVRDPKAGRVSEVRLTTHFMPESGRIFLADMERAFASASPEEQRRLS